MIKLNTKIINNKKEIYINPKMISSLTKYNNTKKILEIICNNKSYQERYSTQEDLDKRFKEILLAIEGVTTNNIKLLINDDIKQIIKEEGSFEKLFKKEETDK